MCPRDHEISSDPDEQYSDSSLRLPSLPHRPVIIEQIMAQSIRDPLVLKHREQAQFTFFCGAQPDTLGGHDGQLEVVGRCLEWFVFDYDIPELGLTPAKHWFNTYADQLSDQQRASAANCLEFILSIFEISKVDPIEGFIANDLLRPGRVYPVSEKVINKEIHSGQMLLGRLFPQAGNYILSGMAAAMSEHATKKIKQFIDSGRLKPELILDDLDGIELENLIGRSLLSIDRIDNVNILTQRLKHYLEQIVPGRLNFNKMCQLVDKADDPVEVAVRICRRLDIHCSHEIELLITYVMSYWFKTRQA